MAKRVTLVVPGLAGFHGATGSMDDLAGLRRLARRSTRETVPISIEHLLWERAGGDGEPPAVAPVTRLADTGRVDDDWWLRADPVCLVAGATSAAMLGELEIEPDESQRLAADVAEYVAHAGYELEAPTAGRWYLRCPGDLQARTLSPDHVRGTDVAQALPTGPAGPRLCTLMNEIQMLLHEHAVNRRREPQGVPPVNALWLWGGGRLQQTDVTGPGRVSLYSSHPYARGLWAMAGVAARSVPASADDLDADEADQLVVLDRLVGSNGTARSGLATLETNWFAPLAARLAAAQIETVEVVDAGVALVMRGPGPQGLIGWLIDRFRRADTTWPWST